MLRGDLPLPWEGQLPADTDQMLGACKGPIMKLLHRDPSRRVSMRSFHDACTNLVTSHTSGEA